VRPLLSRQWPARYAVLHNAKRVEILAARPNTSENGIAGFFTGGELALFLPFRATPPKLVRSSREPHIDLLVVSDRHIARPLRLMFEFNGFEVNPYADKAQLKS